MIKELSVEQEALLPVYRDKWLEIGLNTSPLDFNAAKAAAIKAYEIQGLPAPKEFYKAASPKAAVELIKKLSREKTGKEFKESEIIADFTYGSQDAYWLGFFEYFKDVLGIKECEKLDGLSDLAKNCGWVSFYDDLVVFQDRPCEINRDEDGRFHSETGPAIKYPDGWGVYIWHGVRIPAEWIEEKSKLTPKIALTWANIEQRRCACEILGWDKILEQLKCKVLDEDGDPEIGILIQANIPEIGKEKFLKVQCGTGRTFVLPVPPEMKTALQANAWTYDLPEDMIANLEIRT